MGCKVVEKCGGGRVSEQELSGGDGTGMISAKRVGEGDTERGHCEVNVWEWESMRNSVAG